MLDFTNIVLNTDWHPARARLKCRELCASDKPTLRDLSPTRDESGEVDYQMRTIFGVVMVSRRAGHINV